MYAYTALRCFPFPLCLSQVCVDLGQKTEEESALTTTVANVMKVTNGGEAEPVVLYARSFIPNNVSFAHVSTFIKLLQAAAKLLQAAGKMDGLNLEEDGAAMGIPPPPPPPPAPKRKPAKLFSNDVRTDLGVGPTSK